MITDENLTKQADVTSTVEEQNIFAVGGGKGGVGKTVITASLGVGLAMLGKRVILVDGDLTGANLHAAMGIDKPKKTSFEFFNEKADGLEDLLIEHPNYENLKLLSGPIGSMGMGNIPHSQKLKFIQLVRQLDADFVIMDLGAGNSLNVLDFFLAADRGIMVLTPDPLSILEVYNFTKLALFRRMAHEFNGQTDAVNILKQVARSETHQSQMTMSRFYQEIRSLDIELAAKIENIILEFRPLLLINMATKDMEEGKILALRKIARELLAVDIEYLGSVRRDDKVREALEQTIPFISYDVKCPASRDLAAIIITELLQYNKLKSIRESYALKKRLNRKEGMRIEDAICTVNCLLWEDCGYRNGGHPCELMQMSSLNYNKSNSTTKNEPTEYPDPSPAHAGSEQAFES